MHARSRRITLAMVATLIWLATVPAIAAAHGPVAPVATSYLANVTHLPAGLEAKVIDGDQAMWLRVAPGMTVVVLDYRGAPYLRFSRSGVQINHNSSMFYVNQTPIPATPPANLSRTTPPDWQQASGGHDYLWHEGRLHALAAVALPPGARYVGGWSIPVLLDGHQASISGGVWYAGGPSIVWFWPIAVLLACVLAAWRLRRPSLDAGIARTLAVLALIAVAAIAAGRELHGRPTVSIGQLIEFALILAFVAWGLNRALFQRPGYFSAFVISCVVLWEGIEMIPTLLHGFVLLAVPALTARIATVVCLASAPAMLLLVFRLADHAEDATPSACATATATPRSEPLPQARSARTRPSSPASQRPNPHVQPR